MRDQHLLNIYFNRVTVKSIIELVERQVLYRSFFITINVKPHNK